MMSTLSTAAWAAHDVGLATAVGGTLYGRAALEPALHEIADPIERDRVATAAWQKFSWINLAAHGVVAATWFVGRAMLSGREVSGPARSMTRIKDGLVIASLVTGIGTAVLGRMLGQCARRGEGPAQVREAGGTARGGERTVALQRVVGGLGIANLIANIGTLGITAALAMEGSRSPKFAMRSRCLP